MLDDIKHIPLNDLRRTPHVIEIKDRAVFMHYRIDNAGAEVLHFETFEGEPLSVVPVEDFKKENCCSGYDEDHHEERRELFSDLEKEDYENRRRDVISN